MDKIIYETPLLIIGGGIGGLTLAYELKKENQPFLLIEKNATCGGNIGRIEPDITLGPKLFLASRAIILKKFAKELGVPFKIILENKKRYFYQDGQLKPVAKVALAFVFKFLIKHLLLKKQNHEETFEEFFSKRMGQKGVEELIDPILHGIYAEGAKDLCIDALMPQIKNKNFLKALFNKKEKGLFVFEKGAFELIQKLEDQIKQNLLLNTACEKIGTVHDGYVVTTSQGDIFAKKIVIATEFYSLKQLIVKSGFVIDSYFENFEETSLDVVHLVFDKKQKRPQGSGFLIPQKEGFKILGALFDADLNEKIEGDVLSVFIKGSSDPKTQALFELKKIFKELDEPKDIYLNRYPKKIFKCQKGNAKAIDDLKNSLEEKGIFLLGAYPKVGVCDVLTQVDPLIKTIFNLSTSCVNPLK